MLYFAVLVEATTVDMESVVVTMVAVTFVGMLEVIDIIGAVVESVGPLRTASGVLVTDTGV